MERMYTCALTVTKYGKSTAQMHGRRMTMSMIREQTEELRKYARKWGEWDGYGAIPVLASTNIRLLYSAADTIETLSAKVREKNQTHEIRTETHGVCSDLISRQDAISELDDLLGESWTEYEAAWHDGIKSAKVEIEALPSATVKVGMLICPHCGLDVHSDFDTCPRCGERMESDTE